jgi:hypothetical protein
MSGFYYVHIATKPDITYAQVEAKMSLAKDWYRFDEKSWIVYTTLSSAQKLYERLEPLVKPEGRIFVCRLNTKERQGWMGSDFWTWLKEDRSTL